MSSLLKKAGLIFDENKTKPFLKMSITRLNLLVNKKANHIKISKKEIAKLLADGKKEKARIKVEQVIREDFTIEAYDILELQCELVSERMRLLTSQKEVPPDMEQAVCTIIWAADRAEVAELSTVKSQFEKKYGYEFVRNANLNEDGCVNPKVVEKLDCQPPSGFIVTEYLIGIAEEYGVDYEPAVPLRRKSSSDAAAAAATDAAAKAAAPQAAYEAPAHHHNNPPPGGSSGAGGGGGGISAPPPVTAWAVPSSDVPVATLTPHQSFGGEGGAAAGAAAMPYGSSGQGHYVDASGQPRRGSGGFEAATKGWDAGGGGAGGGGAGKDDSDGPPPPYSPPRTYSHTDIPSPPHGRPMTFDIPAAPGYEDSPRKSRPSREDSSPPQGGSGSGGDSPPASSGEQGGMDDLAARLRNLRK